MGRDIFEGGNSSAGVRDAPRGVALAAIKVPKAGWSVAAYTIYSDRLDIRQE